MQPTPKTAATYRFTLDGKEYESAQQTITGADLRAITGIEHDVRIFVGDHGKHESDHQILSHATVDLASTASTRFYTLAEPSMDIF